MNFSEYKKQDSCQDSRTAASDRFAPPKASTTSTKHGTPVYGMPERPSLRVSRHDFERQKAIENDRAQERTLARPVGKRHEPYNSYVANVQKQSQAAERGQVKGSTGGVGRTFQTSDDNVLKDFGWSSSTNVKSAGRPSNRSTAPEQNSMRAALSPSVPKPAASFAERPADSRTATSLDIRSSTTNASSAANGRFASRHAWEASREKTEKASQGRRHVGSAQEPTHAGVSEKIDRTKDLMTEYPHGASKLLLKKLAKEGVSEMPALGYGSSSKSAHALR